MIADLEILARELKDIAEKGELPDGTYVSHRDGSVEMWAQGWLLSLVDLGVQPAASLERTS